jgi:hypothetical protein
LTHLLDKKLTNGAYFSVGNMGIRFPKWEKDKIISMNEDNPMYGINVRNNFGDSCEICITKTSGNNTKVEFKYNNKRLTLRVSKTITLY